jgi:CheY-like chemotaxis protein
MRERTERDHDLNTDTHDLLNRLSTAIARVPDLMRKESIMITPFTPAIRNANKPRVLIVDDNPRFSQSARQTLQQSGHYVVCEENDAASALGTARGFRPDLILLDLVMPQLDGAEVATQIESDWALHGVPIVFVTGLVTSAEAKNGHRVLSKPVSSSNLLRVVEESLPCRAAA